MSHTWKFLPIAALFALGAFMLFTGTDAGKVGTAIADEPSLVISLDTNPEDGTGYEFTFTDVNADNSDDCEDDDGETITLDDDESYTVECQDNDDPSDEVDIAFSLEVPSHSELSDAGCSADEGDTAGVQSVIDDTDWDEDEANFTMTITDNEHVSCDFDFDFDEDLVTPAATNTSVTGPAATIVVTSSNNNLGCGATSIVTITVRGSNGQPVANGTLVNIVADKGSVSPTSGQTTADGSVFVFYTAPNNTGGEATITAASGSALGNAEIDINCNVQPTQAPPPTSDVSGGGIQPPNTGDGGLSSSNSWHPYAGVALILSSVIATLAVIRPRA
jgi:hypothetical protein